jgi:hypothetical protein
LKFLRNFLTKNIALEKKSLDRSIKKKSPKQTSNTYFHASSICICIYLCIYIALHTHTHTHTHTALHKQEKKPEELVSVYVRAPKEGAGGGHSYSPRFFPDFFWFPHRETPRDKRAKKKVEKI